MAGGTGKVGWGERAGIFTVHGGCHFTIEKLSSGNPAE